MFIKSAARFTAHITSTIGLVCAVSHAHGGIVPSFAWLEDLPGGNFYSKAWDVSADGNVIVGESHSAQGQQAFRWTPSEGMVGLGDLPGGSFYSRAYGVSGDGTVVVGQSNSAVGGAFRWTSASGMTALPGGETATKAWGASFDGSVIVGSWDAQAFRWTASEGITSLGDLGSVNDNTAYGVSADGSVIVGQSGTTEYFEAFRWTRATGMGGLGGSTLRASAVSADGNVIVGHTSGYEAYRWTNAGIELLGGLPDASPLSSVATGVSADGSVIVGTATNAEGIPEAFVWTEHAGMRSVRDLLMAQGLDLSGWSLNEATGVSADGRVIIGAGYGLSGYEAWRAVIPEPSSLLLLLVAVGVAHNSVRGKASGRPRRPSAIRGQKPEY